MKTRFAVSPKINNRWHNYRKQRRQELLKIVADKEVFLSRLANHRCRIDRIATMEDSSALEDRIIVLQRVVAVVIAKWSLGLSFVRWCVSNQGEFCLSCQAIWAKRVRRHLQLLSREQ